MSVHPVLAARLAAIEAKGGPHCPDCGASVQPVGVHELPTQCVDCDPTAIRLRKARSADQRKALHASAEWRHAK